MKTLHFENPTEMVFPKYSRMPDRSQAAMLRWEADEIAKALGHRLAPWVPDDDDDFRVGLLAGATQCRECGVIVAYDLTDEDRDHTRPALLGRMMWQECPSVQTV